MIQGRVYKIVHKSDKSVLPYIGSTVRNLNERLSTHRCHYKKWKEGEANKVSVFEHFDKYGAENFVIVELEQIEVENKTLLNKREQDYIDETECCNKKRAHGIDVEKVKQLAKEYRKTDNYKESIKKTRSTDRYKEQTRIRNERNRCTIWRCQLCNLSISWGGYYRERHLKSKKHQKNDEQMTAQCKTVILDKISQQINNSFL